MKRTRRTRNGALLGAVAALTLVAACGSSDESDDTANDTANSDEASATADTSDSAEEPDVGSDTVEIVTVVPTSGPYAQSGTLMLEGMKLAVDEVNDAGGIEALGGANIELRVEDAGGTIESAVSAAERAVQDGDPVAGLGAYASSFTLAVTEVTERAGLPWVTQSYSDQITDRGFEYVYQTSMMGNIVAEAGISAFLELAEAEGTTIETVALVGDNTAAIASVFDPVRNGVAESLGLEIVLDQVWTPPLTDASSISTELAAADADLILFGATSFGDAARVLESNEQFGITGPYLAGGSWIVLPDYLEGLGQESVEGIVTFLGHPLPLSDELRDNFVEATGEPFMTPDAVTGYAHIWLLKEAIEAAGTADRDAVNAALKEIDLTSGPAAESMADSRIRFDEKGRRIDAAPLLAQWQDGVPVVISPPDIAPAQYRSQFD